MRDFNQYPLICSRHYSEPLTTKIDFRDDISVNLIGLKYKEYDYIKDYCEKHSYVGFGMTLDSFVMKALRYYLEELRSKESNAEWVDNKCSTCGKGIENLIDSREWYENEKPNYCPFCGTRFIMKG